ncbi:Tyrosine recombinase XerD OS=Castellaniella defragrans OX=75697 GN=xerD PE=3 SV=1 [Castellaniella defragrans]
MAVESPSPFPQVDAFLDALWLEDGLSENTLSAYRRDLTAFARWLQTECGRVLEAAQRADIQSWLAAQHLRTKASTANRRLAALRRYYLWALRRGLCQEDPCLGVHGARQPARFPKTLSESQVEVLLSAPDAATTLGLRDRAMLETLYATGLRVSELVHLAVPDTSLSDGVVRVVMGKGAKDRLVPLGEEALHWIERYLAESRPFILGGAPAMPCSSLRGAVR